jgi:hypothetical protein
VHYLVEEETTEGLAGSDPFEGGGAFLGLPGAGAPEILEALERAFGAIVPAVACPGQGAWVDTRGAEGGKSGVVARWESVHAEGRRQGAPGGAG